MLEKLETLPLLPGELKSAFPIRPSWLDGELDPSSVVHRDLDADTRHLEMLWVGLQDRYGIRALRAAEPLLRRGYALVQNGRLIHRDADERSMEQPFPTAAAIASGGRCDTSSLQ